MSGRGRGAGLLVLGALVLLCLSLLPAEAQEHPPELEAIYKRGVELYQAGKYVEAIPVAEEYITVAEARFGQEHVFYANGLRNLGSISAVFMGR